MKEPKMDDVIEVKSSTPIWLKRTVITLGFIMIIIGTPFTINLLCVVPLILFTSGSSDSTIYGVASLTFALLTLGSGFAAYVHGNRALKDKPSNSIRFPAQPMLLVGLFIFLLGLGSVIRGSGASSVIFFPPILLACAILPPLWAVTWMIPHPTTPQTKESPAEEAVQTEKGETSLSVSGVQDHITWRRGLLAFSGGATISVVIAIALEVLLPAIILTLVFNLANTVLDNLNILLIQLSGKNVAAALTNRDFIYLFVQIAIIAPLAEEIAKPLVILPLVKRMGKQETFWLGTLAGAGFAALENVIYAMSNFSLWAGILLVRALGSALHPLGSGLVALGWRDILRGEKDAGRNWWKRFGIAATVHSVWNGGSLLVITLGGARFFGSLPPEVDILGLSAAGTTLAFLIILGLTALWIGRAYGYNKSILPSEGGEAEDARFIPSDRAVALWAVACLIAIVPAGIAGLKLWLR